MPTQCNTKPLEYEPYGRRRVAADFDGGPFHSAFPPCGTAIPSSEMRFTLTDRTASTVAASRWKGSDPFTRTISEVGGRERLGNFL